MKRLCNLPTNGAVMFLLLVLTAMPVSLQGYLSSLQIIRPKFHDDFPKWQLMATRSTGHAKIGELLSDLPTPCLLLEMSLAEGAVEETDLDDVLERMAASDTSFEGSLFVHTKVTDTSERDKITKSEGSGKSSTICRVDTPPELIPGGAYLGIGLANHHVGGYYWARGMGIGAALPAHGIYFGVSSSADERSNGQLFWKKRGPGLNAKETTEESSNSNDGKRSEWADFLAVGDTVQLVPNDAGKLLRSSKFDVLLGIRRIGRPLGADPIVERIWHRSEDPRTGWTVV